VHRLIMTRFRDVMRSAGHRPEGYNHFQAPSTFSLQRLTLQRMNGFMLVGRC
jgi:hypothetical protein